MQTLQVLFQIISFVFFAVFWLGLDDITTEGTFVWSSGKQLSWSEWGTNQPDDSNGNEDCASIPSAHVWNDIPCDDVTEYYPMCEFTN